jgi:fatty acid synthase subunit beta
MASPSSGPSTTRPLVLHAQAARVHILVPASPLSAWVASEVLAQEFHDSGLGDDSEAAAAPADDDDEEGAAKPRSNESQVKLLARFLSFVADKVNSPEVAQVLFAAYNRFNELFLSTVNVHHLVAEYDADLRTEVLTAYFKAFAVARKALGNEVKVAHPLALLEEAQKGKTELYALFGGQGVNEVSKSRLILG